MRRSVPPLQRVFSDRNFVILWLGMFLSTTASYLAILSTSAIVFTKTNSHFSAGSVFAVTWFMPLLGVAWIVALNRRIAPKPLITLCECCFAICCLALTIVAQNFNETFDGDFNENLIATLAIFLVRGFIEGTVKSARLRALKLYVSAHTLEKASSLYGTANFLGIGIGALCGALLVERISLITIYLLTTALFLFVAGLTQAFPNNSEQPHPQRATKAGLWEVVRQIKLHNLGALAWQWIIVVACFQGFHNIARTAYGIEYLGLNLDGIAYIQMITTAAVVSGALFVAQWLTGSHAAYLPPTLAMILTCIAMALLPYAQQIWLCYTLYFIFIFLFEVTFVRIQNEIVLGCPAEFSSTILSFLNALLIGSMAFGVFGFGLLVDRLGFTRVAIGAALGVTLITLGIHLLAKQKRTDTLVQVADT